MRYPIAGETYSEIVRQKFTLYYTSLCPLFKEYMETRRSEWQEDKDFTEDQVRDMDLNHYNNLLTSKRWSTKETKDAQILALVGVAQNLADDYKKSSEKSNTSNRETTKGDISYIMDLPPWILEEPKCGVKKRTENNTGGARNTALANSSGYYTNQNTMGSGLAPHQATEESLIHQAR